MLVGTSLYVCEVNPSTLSYTLEIDLNIKQLIATFIKKFATYSFILKIKFFNSGGGANFTEPPTLFYQLRTYANIWNLIAT